MCSIKYYGNIPSHNRRCGMVRKFEINEIIKEQKSVFFFKYVVPLRGRHQSSIYPDKGEEWQERTEFVIFKLIFNSQMLILL